MKKVKLLDLEFETYVSEQEIIQATQRVAAQIDSDYTDCQTLPLLLITLNGAMIWASQLITELNHDFEWSFVKCSSYGTAIKSGGSINLQVPLTVSPAGRDVIVIEDIVDTGNTWEFLHKYLLEQGAKSVRIATMVLKPEAYTKKIPVDYIALKLNNKFIVGNGLDYNQYGRNLKDLYILCK